MSQVAPAPNTGDPAAASQRKKDFRAKRNVEARKVRSEERKAKRLAKSEAKRERKANRLSRPKSEQVLKSRAKLQQQANRPQKAERKKNRLLAKSKKLEAEAEKLLALSKKAAAQYQALVETDARLKKSQDGQEPAYDLNLDDDEEGPEVEDDSAFSATSVSSSSNDDKDSATDDGTTEKTYEVLTKPRRESDAASVRSALSEAHPESEKEKKLLKKNKKYENKRKGVEVEEDQEAIEEGLDLDVQSMPAKVVEANNDDVEVDDTIQTKKMKRSKVQAQASDDDDAQDNKVKEKKKRKRGTVPEDGGEPVVKETKKSKKTKKDERSPEETAESWNIDQLGGGASRQEKMLRLLGGKKGGQASGSATDAKSSQRNFDSVQAEADLQRQFESGMVAKHEGSRRRGLGA